MVKSDVASCYNGAWVVARAGIENHFAPVRLSSMSFPETRLTLIQRLASGGSEDDWRGFLRDYWGPVCRFALRSGARDLPEAEEIAAHTFEVLWENRLLGRWESNQAAKLRSLLCAVVRRTLSTLNRTRARRENARAEVAQHVEELAQASAENNDLFYAAWVEDIVQQAVDDLAIEYCRKNQSDRMRVFCGRLCEGLTIAKVANVLNLKPNTVDFYFRDVRDRLGERLRELVRRRVEPYCPAEEADEECAREWQQLGHYLAAHGGIEAAVERSYALLPGGPGREAASTAVGKVLRQLTAVRHAPPDASRSQ
jgi:DNA-directed RNA polymerase specialized sigma24 family protein